MTNTETSPALRPPPSDGGTNGGSSGATSPSRPPEQAAASQGSTATTAILGSPAAHPPGTQATVSGDVAAVTATWQSSTVTGLWCINETRNAWFFAANAWRKIYNGRDWAFTALVELASEARATGRSINFRQEADGMVYEIYLW